MAEAAASEGHFERAARASYVASSLRLESSGEAAKAPVRRLRISSKRDSVTSAAREHGGSARRQHGASI